MLFSIKSLRNLSEEFAQVILVEGAIAIDCTVGNGHDTELLCDFVGKSGFVHGFDVQNEAISSAQARLRGRDNFALHLMGHEKMEEALPQTLKGRIAFSMFNLGYLPNSGSRVITLPESTICALQMLKGWLAPGGGISVHIYTGHCGGVEEAEGVLAFSKTLPWNDWRVASYEFINKNSNKETLLLIQKAASHRF